MTVVSRVGNIIISLLMIAMGGLLMVEPGSALVVVVSLTGLSLIVSGVKSLFFYFSLGRSMVGGRAALYRGLIFADLGLFTCTFAATSIFYMILYIAGINLFSGLVDLLRAREAFNSHSPSWRFPAVNGITRMALAVAVLASGFSSGSIRIAVIVYGAGLIYSGIVRIVTSLRKTAIVYIQ